MTVTVFTSKKACMEYHLDSLYKKWYGKTSKHGEEGLSKKIVLQSLQRRFALSSEEAIAVFIEWHNRVNKDRAKSFITA